jgi:hypothetical protein
MAKNEKQKLFSYMQKFENKTLSCGAWQQALEDSVEAFNEENGTDYDPLDMFLQYLNWKNDYTPKKQ